MSNAELKAELAHADLIRELAYAKMRGKNTSQKSSALSSTGKPRDQRKT